MTAEPAGDRAAFARALERAFPDGEVVTWDGAPVYLPCGDPSAAQGTRILAIDAQTRPDLAWELEVAVPAGTTVVVGTFTPPVRPTSMALPVRAIFVAEAPDLTTATVVRRP